VKQIPGVEILDEPKFLSAFREEEFCKFKVGERVFVIEEPFGDNSRYLISAEPPGPCPEFAVVEQTFAES